MKRIYEIILCLSLVSFSYAETEWDVKIKYMNFLGDPQSAEELILVLSKGGGDDPQTVSKYLERFDALGIEALDMLEENLRSGNYNFVAPGQMNLLVRKFNQLESTIDQSRKDEIAELLVSKARELGPSTLYPLRDFYHPIVYEHVSSLLEHESPQVRNRAQSIISSYKKRREGKEVESAAPPSADAVEVMETFQSIEEITPPEEATEVVTAEPTEDPAEKASNWWLWLIGAVVVVGGVGLGVRRKG